MAVHASTACASEDGTSGTFSDGALGGSLYGRRERGEHDLAALAAHGQDAVAVLFPEVFDVRTAGFEDPQPQESEHGDQGEVIDVGGLLGGMQHRFELQVSADWPGVPRDSAVRKLFSARHVCAFCVVAGHAAKCRSVAGHRQGWLFTTRK